MKKTQVEVSIFANNTEYKGSGKSFEDALNSVTPPEKFVTPVTIRVVKDGTTTERMVQRTQMWKLFHANPTIREIILKNFRILFKT